MTVSEKHAEWISLLQVSGSFLAVTVLEEAFPTGLDRITTPFRQRIRSAYDEWRDAVDESDPQIDAIHMEWLSLVIRDFLEHDDSILKTAADLPAYLQYYDVQSDSTFTPDFAVMAGDKAKLLISVTTPNTDLENPLPSESWLASPAERLIALCRTSGVSVGLVTNGERWMVVSVAADGGSSRASWYARLWFQEPVTLQAFYSLLGVRRCFGQEDQTLEALLQKSLGHQDEITDTLGEQVRRAVEVLVQALDRADLDRNRTLLKDVTPEQLFEAGLTVMMRLVVILCAEERGLLLLGEPVYDQNYAISTLRSQLVEQANHGLEILERREDAWSRLLATFRGVYRGITHETLRLPPLGGSLFDPDRFPFLEGRDPGTCWRDTAALPLPIDNRTVLLLLDALQILEHKSGAQMLSYESLDVEQIGHVYEGLLERTVKRVPGVTLGLFANSAVRKKTGHPELLLSDLEHVAMAGEEQLEAFLIDKTGRSKSAITNELANSLSHKDALRLLAACGGDLTLTERIKPFGNLIRTDSWGDPLVYRESAFIVTHGAGRRDTGSHYTPKSLTEPIVKHTLEPLAYTGPAEGKPREEWQLRTSADLLDLKVCDLAMGSGAFLVQSCRWLAVRLVEAWDAEEKRGSFISTEGVVMEKAGDTELLPRDQAERVLVARRLIASRCLYGVDINPMAVELAKLSLWLITMMRNRPFSFLDHALKYGDSLLGVSELKQLERFSMRDPDNAEPLLENADLWRNIEQATELRRELEAMPNHTASQITEKMRLHVQAEALLSKLKSAADFLVAAELSDADKRGWGTRRAVAASQMQAAWKQDVMEFQRLARHQLDRRRPFHWPLEFPEVFIGGGFDAFVFNPPFMGGTRISGALGGDYLNYLKTNFESRQNTDLSAYFFQRALTVGNGRIRLGLLVTKTMGQSDTRETSLDLLAKFGGRIYRAEPEMPWPGDAAVRILLIWTEKQESKQPCILGGIPVDFITPFLTSGNRSNQNPFTLRGPFKSFKGVTVVGTPLFSVTDTEFSEYIADDENNENVIKPYLVNADLSSSYNCLPSRRIIDFGEMSETAARLFVGPYAHVLERVRPFRLTVNRRAHREKWWQYGDVRQGMRSAIRSLNRVLVSGQTTKYLCFVWCPATWVFDQKCVVIATDLDEACAVLSSTVFDSWARKYSATTPAESLSFAPTDSFETFPFPVSLLDLKSIGERYHELRRKLMQSRKEGLTKIYNCFHDPDETAEEIWSLRLLHRQLDTAVAAAYGWSDLAANQGAALLHNFHDTKQGARWTLHPDVRLDILDRLLALNIRRRAEEVAVGLHDKKTAKKNRAAAPPQEPEFALEFTKVVSAPADAKPKRNCSERGRFSADVEQTELLNVIFNCAARREVTVREDLTNQVADALGFKRLSSNLREIIASGINSAIRRGLVTYDASNIHRISTSYAELDHEFLVKAINASIRPGCVYTPEEVLHLAAEYLGCKRLKEAFRERLESALTAASRRGILTKRGDEIRKA